jgi:hypothetical protein
MNFSVKEIATAGGITNYIVLDVANEVSYCLFNDQNFTVELRKPLNIMFVKRITWIDLDVLVKNGSYKLLKEISVKA